MKEALEFYRKHGLEECKRAYALSVNAGCEDLDMKMLIETSELKTPHKLNIEFNLEKQND